jgi:hypothetical protein
VPPPLDDIIWPVSLEIAGLRGFAKSERIDLAIPDGSYGSGMTILVGPNNAGKSTVVESFQAIAQSRRTPSFTEGKRNKLAGDRVELKLINSRAEIKTLATVAGGGSETTWEHAELEACTAALLYCSFETCLRDIFR